jgi:hypothetical protein
MQKYLLNHLYHPGSYCFIELKLDTFVAQNKLKNRQND